MLLKLLQDGFWKRYGFELCGKNSLWCELGL